MKKKVLITDDCHPLLIAGFEKAGFEVDFEPDISPDDTRRRIADYEGLIINSKINVNREFLTAATRLKFVGRLGSGMEIVDSAFAKTRGVAVHSSPEGNRNAVAEQALGMLLALANHTCRADREVRNRIWEREKNRGFELLGKTIGLVGFGHTGSQFAKKLSGLGMHVLAFDKYKTGFADGLDWVTETTMETLFEHADILSLHLPLTAETTQLVDRQWIERCKTGFILLNTSRGKCVRTTDLVDALESGKCGGACLDVFENEKPATFSADESAVFERLYRLENVVLAPHIAGWTHESKRRMAEVLLEKCGIQNAEFRI